ncbi:MAG: Holliday junction resolvase RuvX [Phycisphaeraceae bacterium]|nr:Holliday junction resolvase RuvX [Phycisphaeraceae bacterium]
MRYLAIDFGQRRTGLAVGDDRTAIATPLAVLEESNPQRLLALIAHAAQEQEAAALVVGLPLNMDDSAGPAAQAARQLAEQLGRQTKLPIHLVDERLTSFAAEELLRGQDLTRGKKKARRDALAAATILQQFWQQKNQP